MFGETGRREGGSFPWYAFSPWANERIFSVDMSTEKARPLATASGSLPLLGVEGALIRFCPVNVGMFFALQLQGPVRDITFVMQMGMVEYRSVEGLLLALTNFPAADIAKCPPYLIEKARHLLQSVAVPSPASPIGPQDEGDLIHVTVPFSAPPPRIQDEESLIRVTVPSSASPLRTQDEESLIHVTVPSSASPPRTQDEEDLVETKAKNVLEALLEAIEETKDLLKQDVKDVIRGDLSPAAYDPRVQCPRG